MKSNSHKERMMKKAARREKWYKETPISAYVLANLSKNHPDYGMSPKEHEQAKRERENSS